MKNTIQTIGWTALLALLAALPCSAADLAVLRNGFSIRHERRQVIGNVTRLYVDGDNSSFVDVLTEQIDHFEALPEDAPAQPVKTAPSRPQTPAAQVPQQNPQPLDLDELVNAASEVYRLDPDLVTSVIRAESGFNVRAVSPKGAQGLMQLMPQTAFQLGVANAFDPRANVEAGARYLRALLERYNFDLIKALAAYNAGPERVEQYGGVPPYYETKAYVARVVKDFNKKKIAQKNAVQKSDPQKSLAANKTNTKSKSKTPAAKSQRAKQGVETNTTASR